MKIKLKVLLIFLMIIASAVLITLSVIFYNQGESSAHYSIYPPLGGIGIIIGVIAIILIIRSIKTKSNSGVVSESSSSYAKTIVEIDESYLETFNEKKLFQLSLGYTDGKEKAEIKTMELFGWKLVRKNEYNLTLYFERETKSLQIEKMLLPIAIRVCNDDDRFLDERKDNTYISIELAKRFYNTNPDERETFRYAGFLLSAANRNDFPFDDIYQNALEEVKTREECIPNYEDSSDYSYSSVDSRTSNEYDETKDEELGNEEEAKNVGDYHRIFDSGWSIIGFYGNGFVLDSSHSVIGEYKNGYVSHYGSFYGEYNSSGTMYKGGQRIGRCEYENIYDEYGHMIGKYDGEVDGACAAALLLLL